MLRQLLSAPVDDLGNMNIPKPVPTTNMESPIKSETQEFAVLSNMAPNLPPLQHQYPIYYANQNSAYEYAQVSLPIQYSIDDGYLTQPYSFATQGTTSELFSSTYAVLSSDSEAANEWSQYSVQQVEKVPPAQAYLDPYIQYNGSHIAYAASNNNIAETNKYPEYYPDNDSYTPQPPEEKVIQNTNGNVVRNPSTDSSKKSKASRAQAIEAFRRVAQIPIGKPVSPNPNGNGSDVVTNGDDDDTNERVMCLACKGVYPSRRSLTGHIGRNEKCREIIGRNYLDQMAQAAEGAIPDPTITDGISPVCPYCDRFISHYKGNIRRHINQCSKSKGKRNSEGSPVPNNGGHVEQDVDSSMCNEATSSSYFDYSFGNGQNDSNLYYGHNSFENNGSGIIQNGVVGSTTEQRDAAKVTNVLPGFPAKEVKPLSASASASTTADDPYVCSWCNFKTVYKGNMKRHLISCHATSDEALRQNKFDIEKLRATSTDRPTFLPTSYIDENSMVHVVAGKVSNRGRKKGSSSTKRDSIGENGDEDSQSGSCKRKTSVICDSMTGDISMHVVPMKIAKDASIDSGLSLSSSSSIDES